MLDALIPELSSCCPSSCKFSRHLKHFSFRTSPHNSDFSRAILLQYVITVSLQCRQDVWCTPLLNNMTHIIALPIALEHPCQPHVSNNRPSCRVARAVCRVYVVSKCAPRKQKNFVSVFKLCYRLVFLLDVASCHREALW